MLEVGFLLPRTSCWSYGTGVLGGGSHLAQPLFYQQGNRLIEGEVFAQLTQPSEPSEVEAGHGPVPPAPTPGAFQTPRACFPKPTRPTSPHEAAFHRVVILHFRTVHSFIFTVTSPQSSLR